MKKNKVVVVGAGNVGQAIAYTLMVRRQANEIVIIDIDKNRAESAAQDIAHGTGFFNQMRISAGGYEQCSDADIIIITAGIPRKAGQTRLELAKENVITVREITRDIMKYADNPIIIVVSNPADIITAAVLEESGLHRGRVIGSGTSLDTARFRYIISRSLNVDVSDVSAYVIGEHGDSQVHVWSRVQIAGVPLDDYEQQMNVKLDKDYIDEHTKKGGAEIIAGKGATFYGVAMSVSNILDHIINNSRGVIPVAHLLSDKYGNWSETVISMPCILGEEGIVRTLDIPLSKKEKEKMDNSASILKNLQSQLGIEI